jgi:outer membrane autotransporter protein
MSHGPRSPTATSARLAVAIGFACATAYPASAAELSVTSTADSGAGTLRQAVDDANASLDPANRITFSPTNLGTITVDTSLAGIAQDLSIDSSGAMASDLLVRGPGAGSALYPVGDGVTLTLVNAAFTDGDVVLGDAASVVFDTSFDQTVDQAIRDAMGASGTLVKLGEGELRLTGANSYTGGTTVSEGTLLVTSTSLPGNAVISGDGVLAFDIAMGSPTFAGNLGGTGEVEKRGAGTLTLAGANTYAGLTRVVEGSLIGGLANIPGSADVAQGAILELVANSGMDETAGGVITGGGALHKSGPDRLILQPGNTIASLRVLSGTLAGTPAALSGNARVDAGATLEIVGSAPADSGTIGGALSGAGSVLHSGSAVTTLTAANTVASLRITDGRVVGTSSASIPLLVDVTNPGVLTFNPVTNAVYSGLISGAGDIEKRGGATLELDTAHTFTGTTDVRVGRLHLTGSLASDVDVRAGARLSGSGTIGGRVTSAGAVEAAAGEELTMSDLTLAAGSTLEVKIDPALSADLLTVTNTATLVPGTLVVELDTAAFGMGQQFTIVSAGTLDGKPAFDLPGLFLDFSLDVVGQDLVLTVTPNGKTFETFATNRNQQSVARALDLEEPTATADLSAVIDAIEALAGGVPEAYDALGGEQLSQFATARFELGDRLDRSLLSRLRRFDDALSVHQQATSPALPSVSAGGGREPAVWLEPFGVFGNIDGRQGAHDTDYTLSGVALGADWTPLAAVPNVRLGAAFSYGHSSLGYSGLGGSGTGNSYLGALYGGWSRDWLRVGLTARVGYSDMQTTRRIRFGALDRTARADFDGLDAGARLEAGARVLRGERWVVEPFASLGYAHLDRSGFDEQGAGAVNLRVSGETLDSLAVGAGLRARAIFRIDADLVILPELRSEWSQQLLDRDRRVDARFQDALAGSSIRVYGTEPHRNSGLTGVGWSVRTPTGFEARFGYDVGYGSDVLEHAVGLEIGGRW